MFTWFPCSSQWQDCCKDAHVSQWLCCSKVTLVLGCLISLNFQYANIATIFYPNEHKWVKLYSYINITYLCCSFRMICGIKNNCSCSSLHCSFDLKQTINKILCWSAKQISRGILTFKIKSFSWFHLINVCFRAFIHWVWIPLFFSENLKWKYIFS